MSSILYIGGFELPDRNAAAHMVINNAHIFSDLGFDVYFSGIDKTLNFNQVNNKAMVYDYVSYPRPYPKSTYQWFLDMVSFKRIKEIIVKIPNLKYIVAYNMHLLQLKNLIRYANSNNILVISNLSEWYENKLSLNPVETTRCIDNFITMRFVQKKVDGMLVVSSYLEKYYKDYINKILVLPPLVDIEDHKWKSRTSSIDKTVSFLYAGSIGKGGTKDKIFPIINAFSKIKNKEFVFNIVGLTRNDLILENPKIEEKLNLLGDKIRIWGRVSHAESIEFLLNNDFSIFIRDSSRKNNAGFPTKFVESFTAGINIIASNISDIEDYWPTDGTNYILNKNDEETIQKVIEEALEVDIISLRKSRRNGLVENPFYYRKWIPQLKDFFDNFED